MYIVNVLLFVAIMAFQCGLRLVYDVEYGLHGFVVRDALWIVALHDTSYFIWCFYRLLFNHFVVLDDIENDFGRNNGKLRYFDRREIFVFHFDNTFLA